MESVCLGIPVLGADARGIRDLITTPERGALFPVGRPAALAAAMILAVEDPCGTKPTPDPLWSIDHLLSEHEKIYRKLLAQA
jgi:glycosyltransferase involved in cell wall biosynthesis